MKFVKLASQEIELLYTYKFTLIRQLKFIKCLYFDKF